jgi:hypothetical protein
LSAKSAIRLAVPPGRASADFFSFELAGGADFFFAHERLQRSVHRASQYFRGGAANDGLNNAVDGGAVVQVAAHEGGIDRLGSHENHFEIDSLVAVESLVIGNVERQKTDVGGLDAHSDFSCCGLRMDNPIRGKDDEDHKSNSAQLHFGSTFCSASFATDRTITYSNLDKDVQHPRTRQLGSLQKHKPEQFDIEVKIA